MGNKITNQQGEQVVLRGVNACGLEWSATGEGRILQTVNEAIRNWQVNVIRLPLSQDRWFGHGREQTNGFVSYRALVQAVVNTCATNRCYLILDLHWSNCNEWGRNIGQHSMPDTNSVVFWNDVARRYANHPAVLFDLYNEPHDVSWEVWLHGGVITDTPNNPFGRATPKTYECVGLRRLLEVVRATGARNVVIVGGLDWAYDFSGILAGRQLKDPHGHGVIYANHCYDNKKQSVDTWIASVRAAAARFPVIVSEFGGNSGPSRVVPGENWLLRVIEAIDEHQWSFTAWTLHASARPNLISDWNYTPSPRFGVHVKRLLAGEPVMAE